MDRERGKDVKGHFKEWAVERKKERGMEERGGRFWTERPFAWPSSQTITDTPLAVGVGMVLALPHV